MLAIRVGSEILFMLNELIKILINNVMFYKRYKIKAKIIMNNNYYRVNYKYESEWFKLGQ